MDKKILFQKNANVNSAKGEQVGSLERVVLNPETKVVTHIVIRAGAFFNKEARVVPVDLVAETTENQIILRDEAGVLDAFPPFEERHLIDADGDSEQNPADAPQVIYGAPGFGPMMVQAPGQQVVTQVEQNIPQGTVAMKEGAKVLAAEGEHVGNVERVLADPSVDQVTHLLISRGLFMKENKLIPIKWVMSLGEETVRLRVKKTSVEELDTIPIAG